MISKSIESGELSTTLVDPDQKNEQEHIVGPTFYYSVFACVYMRSMNLLLSYTYVLGGYNGHFDKRYRVESQYLQDSRSDS